MSKLITNRFVELFPLIIHFFKQILDFLRTSMFVEHAWSQKQGRYDVRLQVDWVLQVYAYASLSFFQIFT